MKELTTFWGNTNPAEGKTCTLQYLSERSSRKDMSMAATAILPATVRNMQSRQHLYGKSIWIYIHIHIHIHIHIYICVCDSEIMYSGCSVGQKHGHTSIILKIPEGLGTELCFPLKSLGGILISCFPSYLQHLGAGTFHFACHLQHFGAAFVHFHAIAALYRWNVLFRMLSAAFCSWNLPFCLPVA